MKKIFIISFLLVAAHWTIAQINLNKLKEKLEGEAPTKQQVSDGLKEALTKGTSKGVDLVSQIDGYYKNPEIKIPFPPELGHMESKLREIGLSAQVDKFILALNRAAEDAAKEAEPVFVSAIREMTIEDAWTILKGSDDAATQYLIKTSSIPLKARFKPIIQNSLNKVEATKYYSELVNTYNKIPFVKKVDPALDDYATGRAASGIFTMIAKEEKNIRANPAARTSDLLKKIFKEQ